MTLKSTNEFSIFFILILGMMFSQSSFSQTTYYVSTNGDDSNNGLNSASALESINQGINLCNCGDSIYVLGGNYTEKINAYKNCGSNNRIVVQGDINQRPKITGDSAQLNKYAIGAGGSGFTFRYLDLTSPYPDSCTPSNMVIVGSGDYFDFIDVIVHHSGYDGIKTTADCTSSTFPNNWRIIDSEVHSNGLGCPVSIVNGDGIDFTNCRDCLIDNTIIKDNMGHQLQIKLEAKNVTVRNSHIEGINMIQIGKLGNTPQCDPTAFNADSVVFKNNVLFAKGDTSEFVIKMADVTRLYIENNTIVKDSIDLNVGFICFGGCGSSSTWQVAPTAPIVIRNNIFYNNANQPFFAGPDTAFFDPLNAISTEVTASHNLFYDTHNEIITPFAGVLTSIIADPLFCNYPNAFQISQSSPCINAGDPSSPNDPNGTTNDIGAFYFQTQCNVNINEVHQEHRNLIVPNPASTSISVITSSIQNPKSMIVRDTRGRIVAVSSDIHSEMKLNISTLRPGIYFVMISDQTKNWTNLGKFVKN